MKPHLDSQLRRCVRSRLGKGRTVGLLILFLSASGLLCCLVRVAADSPGATLTAGSPASHWTSYFQRGRYLADVRTTMNLVKYLLEPEVGAAGTTNIVQG